MQIYKLLLPISSLKLCWYTWFSTTGKFRSRAVVEALLDLLVDRENNVRAVAAISLAKAGGENKRVVPALIKRLSDKDRLVRESACLALAHLKAQAAVQKLVQLWWVITDIIHRQGETQEFNFFTIVVLKALVNGFSLPDKSCSSCFSPVAWLVRQWKPDQACWYLNERHFLEEFYYGNILILAGPRKVNLWDWRSSYKFIHLEFNPFCVRFYTHNCP